MRLTARVSLQQVTFSSNVHREAIHGNFACFHMVQARGDTTACVGTCGGNHISYLNRYSARTFGSMRLWLLLVDGSV